MEKNNIEKEQIIEVEASNRFRLKKDYSLLASGYDESDLMTTIANNNLSLYKPIILKKIKEIKERKQLSVNDIQRDKEIMKLIKRRDNELKKLNFSMFEVLIGTKKMSKDASTFKEEILAVLSQDDTKETLADKLKMTYEALCKSMDRLGITMKTLKNELRKIDK